MSSLQTSITRLWNLSSVKELKSLSLEYKVMDEKNLRGTRVSLRKDLGLCMLSLFLPWVFSLYTLYETRVSIHGLFIYISLELESQRLEFLHWTWVSKARDTNLLKCFENMPTNEIVAKIMIKWKICSILER